MVKSYTPTQKATNLNPVSYCKLYKYLGSTINEFLDFNCTAQVQTEYARKTLSIIINDIE